MSYLYYKKFFYRDMAKMTQSERIAIVETKLDLLITKVDKFIEAADRKYATKEELNDVKGRVDTNTSSLMVLLTRWGPLIGVLALLAKDVLVG